MNTKNQSILSHIDIPENASIFHSCWEWRSTQQRFPQLNGVTARKVAWQEFVIGPDSTEVLYFKGCPKSTSCVNPLHITPITDVRDRIQAQLVKSTEAPDCWDWQGATDQKGYERIAFDGKNKKVSQVLMWVKYGIFFQKPLQVNHKCHRRICCRPSHLYIGTQQANINDMIACGHAAWQQKEGETT